MPKVDEFYRFFMDSDFTKFAESDSNDNNDTKKMITNWKGKLPVKIFVASEKSSYEALTEDVNKEKIYVGYAQTGFTSPTKGKMLYYSLTIEGPDLVDFEFVKRIIKKVKPLAKKLEILVKVDGEWTPATVR